MEQAAVKYKFYCVQPIKIETSLVKKLFLQNINTKNFTKFISNDYPLWINEFNKDLYNSMILLNIEECNSLSLKNQLIDSFLVNNSISLNKYLNIENTKHYLFFDKNLLYFNIVYELEFEIPTKYVNDILDTAHSNLDFYNTVRNMIVKETDLSIESNWAKEIKENSLKLIKQFISEVYNLDYQESSVLIENNTGNITSILDLTNIKDKSSNEIIIDKTITLNNIAERLRNYKLPIQLSNIDKSELYHFNGRFHTITIKDNVNLYRYVPIQFHMQFMWFYLKQINHLLEQEFNEITSNNSHKNLEQKNILIDRLIQKIEMIIMFNEKFKLTIENDNAKVYQQIQGNWNIENMLMTANKYSVYFKDFLQRIFNQKTSKRTKKQNNILAFISIFQFIGLIGVWGGYLSLMNDDIEKQADEIIPLFGTYQDLEIFNLFILPSIFLIIVVIMIYYFFKNEK